MRLLDFQVSFNSLPQIGNDIYSQQIIQTYRDLQKINNARKINLQRDQSIVNIYQTGVENKIQDLKWTLGQKKEVYNKNQTLEKNTYEISFTTTKIKKNYNKGNFIDIVV